MNHIMHDLNGLAIAQRPEDGYINATQLCKAAGKRWDNYIRLSSTQEYLNVLSKDLNLPILEKNPLPRISVTSLIQVFQGGNLTENQGTWIHPKLFDHFKYWLLNGKKKSKAVALFMFFELVILLSLVFP